MLVKTSITFATIIIHALAMNACSKVPSVVSAPDPLGSFKAIADKCHAAILESDKVWPGKNGGFGRTAITPGPKTFDVKKTDSLVSPYLGFINLNFVDKSMAAPTEEAVRAWAGGGVTTVNHWRLVYALQDGKWKLQDELWSYELLGTTIADVVPKKMKAGALAESLPAAAACDPA